MVRSSINDHTLAEREGFAYYVVRIRLTSCVGSLHSHHKSIQAFLLCVQSHSTQSRSFNSNPKEKMTIPWRRERDSNPRDALTHLYAFQAHTFSHSVTSPYRLKTKLISLTMESSFSVIRIFSTICFTLKEALITPK